MPRNDLSGKPIAITGASSGIGRATALLCARAGMPVALGARRQEKLDELAEEIERAGGRAIPVATDVDDPDSCRGLIERTVGEFGSVYAVFANAGYGFEAPVHEVSEAQHRAIFETNYWGTVNTCAPALEHMLRARTGHVVICASSIGKVAIPYNGVYCATKAAQTMIGRAMRHELRPHGIHVSTVHPIGTRTEFFEKAEGRSRRWSRSLDASNAFMQPPERVGRAVVRCLRRPRTEVWTSLTVRWLFALMNASPGFADVALDIQARKQRKRMGEPDQERLRGR